MGKFSFMSLLVGSLVNFHVDSQNIANFLGTVPVLGRFMQDLELDSVFMNLPFLHNDVTKIKFLLYTSKNPTEGEELKLEEPHSFRNSYLNPDYPLKILIHGYAQSANSVDFPKSLKDAYLDGEKSSGRGRNGASSYNVISLDWSVLSKEIIYFSSAVHTEKVGQRVGEFIVYLKDNKYIRSYSSVHVIGFSLGSHVAGIAGNFVQTATNGSESIGRITGLDPAGPGFISVPMKIRLDSGDADFVDIIHTNMGSVLFAQYGTPQKLGHVDFFPNGGSRQPACDVSLLTEYTIPRRLACNHLKAAEYYKRSIQGEVFRGCSCSTWGKFQQGACGCSQSNSTAVMGEFCSPTTRGRFYLNVK
ncbi:unnamed protein product [Allacma fusca]|uniref:Lipase domain-containing protein n=1 Tax=Allacma fusca TaxID=39272 RepID=A0A8J2L7P8_9HEXA|nr:unnamed protein product [Allacma fusca]